MFSVVVIVLVCLGILLVGDSEDEQLAEMILAITAVSFAGGVVLSFLYPGPKSDD